MGLHQLLPQTAPRVGQGQQGDGRPAVQGRHVPQQGLQRPGVLAEQHPALYGTPLIDGTARTGRIGQALPRMRGLARPGQFEHLVLQLGQAAAHAVLPGPLAAAQADQHLRLQSARGQQRGIVPQQAGPAQFTATAATAAHRRVIRHGCLPPSHARRGRHGWPRNAVRSGG